MKLRVLFSMSAALLIAALSYQVTYAGAPNARTLRVGVDTGQTAAAAATAAKSIWDGVFTEEQAKRGQEAYQASCSECHGGDLMGDGFAPSLAGADFQGNWNDLTAGDLFERIRISMPPSGPSSVTPAAKADILAHIFNMNKYPTGTTELEPKTEALKSIKIELKK